MKNISNISKYQWFKIAKQHNILFTTPSTITINNKSYSEGQEILVNKEKYIITHIDPTPKENIVTLLSSNNKTKIIYVNSNNKPFIKKSSVPSVCPEWTHNGYTITLKLDKEPDNVKKTFTVTTPDNITINANINPYTKNNEVAKLWVDAGCPMFQPPKGGGWDTESLKEYIETNKSWYEAAFGGNTAKSIKISQINKISHLVKTIKEKLQATSNKHEYPTNPDLEPFSIEKPANVFCGWCNKPLGHNPKLKQDPETNGPSHGICEPCFQNLLKNEICPQSNKTIQAQNNVNMGAEINQGMPTMPVNLSNQQEQQIQQADVAAEIDAHKGLMNTNEWKKSLTPGVKRALQLTPQEMARKISDELNFVKDPKSKASIQRLIEECSKNPAQSSTVFKSILNRINKAKQQDHQMTPQQIQDTQSPQPINPMNPMNPM